MKKDYTKIIVILDSSGSMDTVRDDIIGGYNTFITDQAKLPGKCDISLYTFSTHWAAIFKNRDINIVEVLTRSTYFPNGSTALYDATCGAIDDVGRQLSEMKEEDRPDKVIVSIITDGEENSSKEYTKEDLAERIKRQQDVYKWEFLFVGSNFDVYTAGTSYGLLTKSIYTYDSTSLGVQSMYRNLTANINALRSETSDEI